MHFKQDNTPPRAIEFLRRRVRETSTNEQADLLGLSRTTLWRWLSKRKWSSAARTKFELRWSAICREQGWSTQDFELNASSLESSLVRILRDLAHRAPAKSTHAEWPWKFQSYHMGQVGLIVTLELTAAGRQAQLAVSRTGAPTIVFSLPELRGLRLELEWAVDQRCVLIRFIYGVTMCRPSVFLRKWSDYIAILKIITTENLCQIPQTQGQNQRP